MKLLVAILLVALVASVSSLTSHFSLSTSLYNQQQQGEVEYGAITIKSIDNQETKVHGSVVSLNGEFKKRIGSDATVSLSYTLEAIKILIAYMYEKPKSEDDFHRHRNWPWRELFAIAREFRINELEQDLRKGLIYWLTRTESSFKDIIPFVLEHHQTVIEAFWKNLAASEDILLFAKEVYLKRNLPHGERFLDYARSNHAIKASELFWQAFTNYSIKPGYAIVRKIVTDRDSVGIPISVSDDANRIVLKSDNKLTIATLNHHNAPMMLEKGINGDNAILSPDGEVVYIINGTGLYRKTAQRNDYLSSLSCLPKRLQFVGKHAETLIIEDGQILAFDTRHTSWRFCREENLVLVTQEILAMINAPKKVVLCPRFKILQIYREGNVFELNIENTHTNVAISSNSGDFLVVYNSGALAIFKYFEPKFELEVDNENSDIDECFEDNQ